MSTSASTAVDTIDVGDLARTVRRGWRAVAAFTVLGALVAGAVVLWAPPKFLASASLVMKMGSDPGSSLLSRLSGGLGDAAGGALSAASKSPTETEIQILASRAVAGRVVDSLRLQVRVTSPRGFSSSAARRFGFARLDPSVRANTTSPRLARPIASRGRRAPARRRPAPQQSWRLARSSCTQLESPTNSTSCCAIAKTRSRASRNICRSRKLVARSVRVNYRGDDSLTAAAAANALIANYLARRTTADRGINQHRVEFLTAKADSAAAQLRRRRVNCGASKSVAA